jgi:hypothetical protein
VADEGAERVLALIRRSPGKSTTALGTLGRLDSNWLRARLAELVADGRAVCTNGRWFARGPR